MTQDNF